MFITNEWRKARKSSNGGGCGVVRLSPVVAGGVEIGNDTRPGESIHMTPAEWDAFQDGVRNGEFELPTA